MEFHEAANLFPLLEGAEFEQLKADIAEKGLLRPIWTHDDKILDGRNRYLACQELGIEPVYREWNGEGGSPVALIVTENLQRRNLTTGQEAAIGVELLPMLEAEARERQKLAGRQYGRGQEKLPERIPEALGEARAHAADMMGTNPRYISDAKKLKEKAPDLLERVKAGELTIPAAMRELRRRNKPRIQLGEWWQLGRHLLYCGDTSEPAFYKNMPDAAFAFADPPYNAGAAEWDNDFKWGHDWLIEKAPLVAVTPGVSSIFDFARITSMPYVWSMACWIDNGMTRGALGFGNWIYIALFSHESIYRRKQDHLRVSIRGHAGSNKHKGKKPPALMAALLEMFSDRDDTVLDPFLGSGTTLFVAEKLGRTCIGGDIEPAFCSMIAEQWQDLTGLEARRL